jgi:hypothetical protein
MQQTPFGNCILVTHDIRYKCNPILLISISLAFLIADGLITSNDVTHFPNDFEFVFPPIAGIGNDWQPLQREKRQKEFVCGVS